MQNVHALFDNSIKDSTDHTCIGMHKLLDAFKGRFVCFENGQDLNTSSAILFAYAVLHTYVCTALPVLWLLFCCPANLLHRAANFRPEAVKLRDPCVISNLQQNMLKQCNTKMDELFVSKLWSVA